MIYLDTSAMVKLVAAEPESKSLIDWLNDHPDESLVTSSIGRIELIRAASRIGAVTAALRLASTIDTLVLSDSVAAMAATIGPPELRTLDAIHLATAHMHQSRLLAFCAYGHRLSAAARLHQLLIAAPGRAEAT